MLFSPSQKQSRLLSFIKQYYKSIVIGILILWLSLTGSNTMIPGRMLAIPYIDKIGHFAMYAFFSAVLLLDSGHWKNTSRFHYFILIIPAIFGGLLEIMQMTLTSTRKAELLDLCADLAGVAAGIGLAVIAVKILSKIKS